VASSDLIRWSGLSALVSGVVSVIGDLLRLFVDVESAESATTASYAFVFLMYLVGTALLLLGLVGLYVSQSEDAGILGLVGFLAAFLGTVLLAGTLWFELFITPALAVEDAGLAEGELGLAGFVLAFLLVVLGWLLFGAATLRARVYPRWAAVLLIVGVVISFFPIPLSGVVFSAAVVWMGFVLFTRRGETTHRPSRVGSVNP
jgi:uncharacterized membrane protein